MVGDRYANRYQAMDVIGQDEISVLRRGHDLLTGRDVAIRVLRADVGRDPLVESSFRAVAHQAAALNHPAFLAVYDTGDTPAYTGSTPFMVMEHAEGDRLRTVLDRDGALPWRRALRIAAELCAAVEHAHRRNLVPCHITPADVLVHPRAGVDAGDQVKVLRVRQLPHQSPFRSPFRLPSGPAGALATQYLSPEELLGQPVDARSDQYTIGCVMFEMLCGRPVFTGPTADGIAAQHLREASPAPSRIGGAVRPGVPRDVDEIVLTTLSKKPANRYDGIERLRSDIDRLLAGRPLADRDRVDAAAAPRPRGRRVQVAPGAPLLAPGLTLPVLDDFEQVDPDRQIARRRRWTYVGVGAVSLALVAAMWLTLVVITMPPPPPKVAAPDVVGMTVGEAIAILEGKGLDVGAVTTVDTDRGAVDTVVSQRPSVLTQVEAGTDVELEVEG